MEDQIKELRLLEKVERLRHLKPNSLGLLLENRKTLEYFLFSKECLETQRSQKKEKVLTVEEFPNKQKHLALKALLLLLKSKEASTAGALKKHWTNLGQN
jgi:hypothetical protein